MLRFVLLFFTVLLGTGIADAKVSAPPTRSYLPSELQTARNCLGEEGAPITFYGSVPVSGMLGTEHSVVQILLQSSAATYYLAHVVDTANGVIAPPPADTELTEEYVRAQFDIAKQVQKLLANTRNATILRTGQFVCRGFRPGNYVLLATVHALTRSSQGGADALFETYFYRADVSVPPTRKSSLIVTVPAFRLLGQSPPK